MGLFFFEGGKKGYIARSMPHLMQYSNLIYFSHLIAGILQMDYLDSPSKELQIFSKGITFH